MQRCLDLASMALGNVAPNPMVGAVLVYEDRIIGEGFHQKFGEAHAEKNAIESVLPKDRHLVPLAMLYVSLEPCAHFGKTPPCSDLILLHEIKKVVIGTIDPFIEVAGRGMEKLKNAGVEIVFPVLEKECQVLNKRFFTFHQKKRPYIILKWAQTANGLISSSDPADSRWISNSLSQKLVHKWRTEEQAILVGTNTARVDNPRLTVRSWEGNHPLRVVLDKNLHLPKTLHIFDGTTSTLVYTSQSKRSSTNLTYEILDFDANILATISESLYNKNIQSLIVEGGAMVLQSFIKANLWDEARVFTSPCVFKKGLYAPVFQGRLTGSTMLLSDTLQIYNNTTAQ